MNERNEIIIHATNGKKYISDFDKKDLPEFPTNCIFNKMRTNCGATEMVLRGDKPYIIAGPSADLVVNKTTGRKDMLGVKEGVSNAEVEEYGLTHDFIKIFTTYNSLPRVITALEKAGRNPQEEVLLVIDEYQILLTDYVLRQDAIIKLFPIARTFKEVTYMSATPIPDEYMLDELKHLPVYKIEWPDPLDVTIRMHETLNPM